MIQLIKLNEENNEEYIDTLRYDIISDITNCYMIFDSKDIELREPLGVIEYRKEFKDSDDIHIDYLEIFREHRGKGIAREVIELLNRDYTITGDSVIESIGFWLAIGAEFEEELSDEAIDIYIKQGVCIPFIIH